MNKNLLAQVSIEDKFGAPITVPGGGGTDVGTIVSNLLLGAYALAGIILIFGFIFAGISLIKGAGSGTPETTAKGKKALQYAIIGFVIVFTSYWIIQIIEVILGVTIITDPNISFT